MRALLIYAIITVFFSLNTPLLFGQISNFIKIRVLDRNTEYPIAQANIRQGRLPHLKFTDVQGEAEIEVVHKTDTLSISKMGYDVLFTEVRGNMGPLFTVYLTEKSQQIDTVLLSTGYEQLQKRTATGSFESINKEQLQRTPTFDILGRLKQNTTGLYFNEKYDLNEGRLSDQDILLRGLSTLRLTQAGPLIILDDFPYEGSLSDINPNDIEDVTLLKDAAATSIWGSRAGNGVIVIKTKKSNEAGKVKSEINASFSVRENPNLKNTPALSTSDYIAMERFLFAKGYYQSLENNRAKLALTPVVELLIKQREGLLSEEEVDLQIDKWGNLDVRDQFMKYVYRPAVQQQYSWGLHAGGPKIQYNVSLGYDDVRLAMIGNDNKRFTIMSNTVIKPTKQLTLNLQFLQAHLSSQTPNPVTAGAYGFGQLKIGNRMLYPYAQFADELGNPLSISKDYRSPFTELAEQNGLLPWTNYPLKELELGNNVQKDNNLTANVGVNYKMKHGFNFDVKYQFFQGNGTGRELLDTSRYYTRNLINRYTQVNGEDLQYNIPLGGILFESAQHNQSHQFRSQVNWSKTIWNDLDINAFVGSEIRQSKAQTNGNNTYGFDEETLTWRSNLNFSALYPIYGNLAASSTIPVSKYFTSTTNRYVSFYSNARINWRQRYLLSGSVRKDASNLFGVKTNNKWSPLWSVGAGWVISKESFFETDMVDFLKVRSSFGYAGNVNNGIAAYTTLSYFPDLVNYEFYERNAYISSAPNPSLRWEKVNTLNFGVDLSMFFKKLDVTLDYYKKRTSDLITANTLDPTTGVNNLQMNVAHTKSNGVDLRVSSINRIGMVNWTTTALFTYNENIVTKYLLKRSNTAAFIGVGLIPQEDYNAFPIFSYKWAGLEPTTGDPIGYLDGQESKDYSNIVLNSKLADLNYHGASRPLYFGSLRNEFNYHSFSLSFTLSYFFDYYFRRSGFSSSALIGGEGHADYALRWQKPGDEVHTQVPSFQYPANTYRDQFYLSSDQMVHRGDHIRVEDIRLAYLIPSTHKRNRLGDIAVSMMLNQVGVLWTRNELKLDPQNPGGIAPPRTFSIGMNVKF